MAIKQWLDQGQVLINQGLRAALPAAEHCPRNLLEAMEYSLFAGGKRLRPLLAMAAAEACGGSLEQTLPAASALEMVHTYSLIHDDLPAMDDDDWRRGAPSSHKKFGEALAILAGDALLTHSFFVISTSYAPTLAVSIISELAGAAGPTGMVAGQVMDLSGCGSDIQLLKKMYAGKTGALVRASVRIGGLTAGAEPNQLDKLGEYGAELGLAYQIVDDILDVVGDPDKLGKDTGADARNGKVTFIDLYGLEEAKQLAVRHTGLAIEKLQGFGADVCILRELALYLNDRIC